MIGILLKSKNIKSIKLPVSAPFHCKLMNKATITMKREIEQIEFKNYVEILEKKDNTDGLPLKYVITHISGMQTNIISKDFEQMKRYNSVPENIQYLYLCLRFICQGFMVM